MNALRVVGLGALLMSGCGGLGPNSGDDPIGVAQAALTGCPGARSQSSGTIGTGQSLYGGWISATGGQRLLAKMVGVTSPGHADLYLQRSGSGSWVAVSATSGTSTEIIDIAAPVSDSYRIVAYGADGTDTVRFTFDVSDTSCGAPGTPVDYCFGAIGKDCDGIWPAASCSTNSDATVVCQNSVGSQMHDTCCSFNPLGSNCGGTSCNPGTSGTNCGYVSDCSAEWNHAQNDVTTTRTYSHTYDPTVPTYRPEKYAKWPSSDRNVAQPTSLSMKTPVGKALWNVDAQNGWCTNPTSYSTYWSWQGYYSVCR